MNSARPGQNAVVMGAGCIGLVTMMALKAMGVSKVYVVDIMEKRLQKAMDLEADSVINGSKVIAPRRDLALTFNKKTLRNLCIFFIEKTYIKW